MTKISIKVGDIFAVRLDNIGVKYFQYIANDRTQLNSDVIRVFSKTYPIGIDLELPLILNDKIDFYAHCIIRVGIKMGIWEKIGHWKEVGNLNIKFRGTNDYGHKIGETPIEVSKNWYVWNINDENFTKVGELKGENQKAEIGLVFNPISIVQRMRTGKYDNKYPSY